MTRFLTLLLALVALAAPSAARAHAEFRGSEPAANALLEEAPADVVLQFSEPVSPLVMRLALAGGDIVEAEARSDDTRVIVSLPDSVGRGSHLLSWRVVSLDGHPIGGSLVFSVGAVTSLGGTEETAGPTAVVAAVARFVLTLALVAGIGATIFVEVVARGMAVPARVERIAWWGCVAVIPAAILAVATQGLDMLGLPLVGLVSSGPWIAGVGSPTALTALLAVLAALAGLAALRAIGPGLRIGFGLAAWALAAFSYAASGHATVADPRWISAPSVALHGLALVFWMGCLLPLLLTLFTQGRAAPVLARFSAIAIPMVALLFASGVALAAVQSRSVDALVGSSYGAVLLVKLVAVAALLALAACNRLALTPWLEAGRASARGWMGRTIRAEIVLGLVVLALASGFRLTAPPRSIGQKSAELRFELAGHHLTGDIALAPARIGPNDVSLRLASAHGDAMEPQDVEIRFSLPERELQPISVPAARGEDGVWTSAPVTLPIAGNWSVAADVLVTDFIKETLSVSIPIAEN